MASRLETTHALECRTPLPSVSHDCYSEEKQDLNTKNGNALTSIHPCPVNKSNPKPQFIALRSTKRSQPLYLLWVNLLSRFALDREYGVSSPSILHKTGRLISQLDFRRRSTDQLKLFIYLLSWWAGVYSLTNALPGPYLGSDSSLSM